MVLWMMRRMRSMSWRCANAAGRTRMHAFGYEAQLSSLPERRRPAGAPGTRKPEATRYRGGDTGLELLLRRAVEPQRVSAWRGAVRSPQIASQVGGRRVRWVLRSATRV